MHNSLLMHLLLKYPENDEIHANSQNTIATGTEFRVWGFSWSGKSFIWSDEVDIRIYSRV